MTSKSKFGSAVIIIIGVIGTVATLVSMPDTYSGLRSFFLIICSVVSLSLSASLLHY
jgi:hypothetical protein